MACPALVLSPLTDGTRGGAGKAIPVTSPHCQTAAPCLVHHSAGQTGSLAISADRVRTELSPRSPLLSAADTPQSFLQTISADYRANPFYF